MTTEAETEEESRDGDVKSPLPEGWERECGERCIFAVE
jgi:hypothetical protein